MLLDWVFPNRSLMCVAWGKSCLSWHANPHLLPLLRGMKKLPMNMLSFCLQQVYGCTLMGTPHSCCNEQPQCGYDRIKATNFNSASLLMLLSEELRQSLCPKHTEASIITLSSSWYAACLYILKRYCMFNLSIKLPHSKLFFRLWHLELSIYTPQDRELYLHF